MTARCPNTASAKQPSSLSPQASTRLAPRPLIGQLAVPTGRTAPDTAKLIVCFSKPLRCRIKPRSLTSDLLTSINPQRRFVHLSLRSYNSLSLSTAAQKENTLAIYFDRRGTAWGRVDDRPCFSSSRKVGEVGERREEVGRMEEGGR